MKYRQNTYRWFFYKINMMWHPRGILNYECQGSRPLMDWHKTMILSQIDQTRKLLDDLEAKINKSRESSS